jgi:signal transduction histidine kinase
MRTRLSQQQLLLGSLLPLFAITFALHVEEVAHTGLAQLPVFARWVPGDYPVVAGYRLETDSSDSGLLPGDRLLRVGDRDLRGAGYVGFQAIGLSLTWPGHPVPLVFERDGVQHRVELEARPHPQPWTRIPILLLVPIVSVLLLLRAPGSPSAQRFFLCFMTYAIGQAHFYGGPEWKTWAAATVWTVAAPAMLFFMMQFVRLFPEEMPDAKRVSRAWTWVVCLYYVVFVRVSYILGWPTPSDWIPRVSFATHGLMSLVGIATLVWNYFHAYPVGRRRLRWILLGMALGSAPVIAAGCAPLVVPEWEGFRNAFAVGFLASAIWMMGVVLAVVRENAFDVDRLIGATAAWALAAGGAVALLAVTVPPAASGLSTAFGLEPTAVRLALAAILGALAVPVGIRLRPRVDQVLFPERVGLQAGVERILGELARQPTPGDLVRHAAKATESVMRVAGVAVYRRDERGLHRESAWELDPPLELPHQLALPVRVATRNAPEVLARAGVRLVVPICLHHQTDALICLGPKRSGDIFTNTDVNLLTTIAGRVEAEWLRFEKEAADRESRAKTNLLAVASHDLRQPLHALSLLTEVLSGKLEDSEMRELVSRIGASTQDLDEMLTSLLDRSKLDAGGIEPEVRVIALAEVFAQLERDFGLPAEDKGLRLRVVPSRLAVQSDPLLLTRILRNLVSNAIRYTPRGAILVGARVRDGDVIVEVRDSGPGIPRESQAEIFEAFRQLSRGSGAGLGLGLSIVDGLARVLGHRVSVRSAPGRGSTFRVVLPRAERQPAVPASARAPSSPLGIRRVLVVDDDARVREATVDLLSTWGLECRAAADPDEACRTVTSGGFRPEFVLADFHLAHGRTGVDALAAIRPALGSGWRAAILTAETEPAHGYPVLSKPIRPAQLRAVLSAPAAPT